MWLRVTGFAIVLSAHIAVLSGLWHSRTVTLTLSDDVIFVKMILPTVAREKPAVVQPIPEVYEKQKLDRPKPASIPVKKPRPAETPEKPVDAVQQKPALPQVLEQPVESLPEPVQASVSTPVMLNSELSLSCSNRTAPRYPRRSVRLREQGRNVLRVELDKNGKVVDVQVEVSSGYPRLDEAAIATVRTWRCKPAKRDGQAVATVARQPFNFVLNKR